MSELKPCPFCKGKAVVYSCDGSGHYYNELGTPVACGRNLTHLIIICDKCGIRTKPYLTRKGVFNAWNRRDKEKETAEKLAEFIECNSWLLKRGKYERN